MNTKYTLGLLVAFVALAAAAYYAGRGREPVDLAAGTATPTPAPLFEFDPGDVEELVVDGDGGSITLTRAAGGWEVNGQAANDSVDGVVERLAKPVPIRTLPEDRDPDTYGFAAPTLTVTLKTQSGEEKVFVYGDEAPVDAHVYVQMGGSPAIHLFSSGDWNTLRDWLTNPPYRPTATPDAESTPSAEPEETADATVTEGAGPPEPGPSESPPPPGTSVATQEPTPKTTPADPRPPATEPPTGPSPGVTGTAPPSESTAVPTLAGAAP
jgi:hypothetical protein